MNIPIPKKLLRRLLDDKQVRISATMQDILLFFNFYFPHYITHKTADFQMEILKILQDQNNKFVVLTAFRGSAKSTFCSLLLPIWSALGCHKKKHIVLVCQNQQRAQQLLGNIKLELETNDRLIADYGPFVGTIESWNMNTLILANGTRITAVSIGESIRGIRQGQYRPDLVISDDVEDVQSARINESRDKLWQFVNGELIPAGDITTRFIFIGNLVHMDSLMMRLRKAILIDKKVDGIYREYRLIDQCNPNYIAWPGKYPTLKDIQVLKNTIISEVDFLREYCLTIIPEGNQIIFPQDFQRYDEKILERRSDFYINILSTDPALSERQTSDNTSITHTRTHEKNGVFDGYVMPNPINKKMTGPDIITEIKRLIHSFPPNEPYVVLVEDVAFQRVLVQTMQTEGINAIAVGIEGLDKRSRLSAIRQFMRTHIYFPKYGTEIIEGQLLGFGVERYDDLVDSVTLLCKYLINLKLNKPAEPIMVPYESPFGKNFQFSSNDWADQEDEEIFANLNKRRHQNDMGYDDNDVIVCKSNLYCSSVN